MRGVRGVLITLVLVVVPWVILGLIGLAAGVLPPETAAAPVEVDAGAAPDAGAAADAGPAAADAGGAPGAKADAGPSAQETGPDAEARRLATTYDGDWSEPECQLVDVSDLEAAYKPDRLRETVKGLAERRYPIGVPFIDAQDDHALGTWFPSKDSFRDVVLGFDTAVHEGSHIWAAHHRSPRLQYRMTGDRTVQLRPIRTFNRSEIVARHASPDTDGYVQDYLTGDSGQQPLSTLLDELNAYTHSLASRYCTRDLLPAGASVSARDGILTMLYYVTLYLGLARTDHPQDYQRILADPGHVQMILDGWERARFWLARSAPYPALGLRDADLVPRAFSPEAVAEIERVRANGRVP